MRRTTRRIYPWSTSGWNGVTSSQDARHVDVTATRPIDDGAERGGTGDGDQEIEFQVSVWRWRRRRAGHYRENVHRKRWEREGCHGGYYVVRRRWRPLSPNRFQSEQQEEEKPQNLSGWRDCVGLSDRLAFCLAHYGTDKREKIKRLFHTQTECVEKVVIKIEKRVWQRWIHRHRSTLSLYSFNVSLSDK